VRAVAVAVLLLARVAAANDLTTLPLADAPIDVQYHLSIRPLAGSVVKTDGRVVFELDTARLVMLAEPTALADGPDLKAAISRSLAGEAARVAHAPIEPFASSSGLTGFAVLPHAPYDRRDLVFAAYVAGADGIVVRLTFYVEDDQELADPTWAAVARRVALTAQSPALVTKRLGPYTVDLPRGGRAVNLGGNTQVFSAGTTTCFITTGKRGPRTPPSTATRTAGSLLDEQVAWLTWHDDEWSTVATVDDTTVTCRGPGPNDVVYGRYLAGTLAAAP
jgi:hypothetical protein